MSSPRDTKAIAQRIDIRYVSRPSWYRWLRRWTVLLTAAGVLAWVVYVLGGTVRGGGQERLLNPGPVAMAHAHFENNCAACHDANGKGGFFKTVSDNACLTCHDAGSHHPRADLNPGKSDAVHLTSLANPAKAADCRSCHVEHRGREALVGLNDQLCLQCHADLARHGGSGGMVERTVTAFSSGYHPQFGKRLPTTRGVELVFDVLAKTKGAATRPVTGWADRAWERLRFKHGILPHRLECTTCHRNGEPAGIEHVQTALVAVPPGRRYMSPVTYQEHCRTCHPLGLPATVDLKLAGISDPAPMLTHGPMSSVRAELNDLDQLYLAILRDHPKLLKPNQSVAEWLDGQRDQLVEELAKIKKFEEELPDAQSAAQKSAAARAELQEEMKKTPPDEKKLNELRAIVYGPTPGTDPERQFRSILAQAAEYEVATKLDKGNCLFCHQAEEGSLFQADFEKAIVAAGSATGGVPEKVVRFRTAPTSLPSTPRRWFTHAIFDHDAHRDVTCLTCHQGMDRDLDAIARLPTMETCLQCHHADTSTARGARTSCVTCHEFHDRSRERVAFGTSIPRR